MQNFLSSHNVHFQTFGDSYLPVFEANLSEKFEGNAVLASSGNPSISLKHIFHALGVIKGDEVILPALCQRENMIALRRIGIDPIFVDIQLSDYAIDPEKITEKITNQTKAIIITHLFGQPALHIERILEIAKKNSLKVVENISHAFGSKLCVGEKWRAVGTFGDVGYFNFSQVYRTPFPQASGIICKKGSLVYEKLNGLRLKKERNYLSTDELMLIERKCDKIEHERDARKDLAAYYEEQFRLMNYSGIASQEMQKKSQYTFSRYIIRVTEKEKMIRLFANNNLHYSVPEKLFLPGKKADYIQGTFLNAEKAVRESILLPISGKYAQIEAQSIINAIKSCR